MIRSFSSPRLILLTLVLWTWAGSVSSRSETVPPAPATALADPLLPDAKRLAGTSLSATPSPSGLKWISSKVILGEHGATASAPGGAHHVIPAVAGTIRLQADIDPKGSGFTGLALGRGDLSNNFWVNLSLVFWISKSSYSVTHGTQNLTPPANKALLRDGSNHLVLAVDTLARTISAELNGTPILKSVPGPATLRWTDLTAAGFRFNEPLTSGEPVVANYQAEIDSKASTQLTPVDVAMCVVEPDRPATLTWRVGVPGPTDKVPYVITDYGGRELERTQALRAADQTVTITRAFPRGYSEIAFPEAGQTFGIVSLEPFKTPADPFFSIDSGLSWLEQSPERRTGLIKILARSGIAMARERLGLGSINPAPGKYDWETGRHFDTVRQQYAAQKVQLLEILGGGAKHFDPAKDSHFPRNLWEVATTTGEAARHWSIWGGAEGDNEVDLRPFPADQYVPMIKAMSFGLAAAPSKVPLVAGVFATIPPGPFFDTCTANGLLDDADVISFHSYDRAPAVEGMIARYRAWLKTGGKEAMPLWHTECGWSWTKGPDRPPRDQDALSALEISAKAVETMACGVARYFPFVYVYYEEGTKNFGMMGREATPLRSYAAYAACARTLAGSTYLGDLDGLPAPAQLARIFSTPAAGECVAVVYTGRLDPAGKVKFPVKVKRVTGADGRPLGVVGEDVPVPDGLAYVWLDRAALGARLKADTTAKRLYTLGRQPLTAPRLASPLILQFLPESEAARTSPRRYLLTEDAARHFPFGVRVHNLSSAPLTFTPRVKLAEGKSETAPAVTVPSQGFQDIHWQLDVSSVCDIARTSYLTIDGQTQPERRFSPLAIPLMMEGTLEQHLKRYPRQAPLPIVELGSWKPNQSATGTSKFSQTADHAWRMDVKYPSAVGVWAYPKFRLPAPVDPVAHSALLIRLRVMKPAAGVAIIAGSDGKAPSFWVTDLCPADGEWHTVYIPFAEFKPGPNSPGNQNTRLDPTTWTELSLGMGSRTPENALEISHLILVGGAGD